MWEYYVPNVGIKVHTSRSGDGSLIYCYSLNNPVADDIHQQLVAILMLVELIYGTPFHALFCYVPLALFGQLNWNLME